MDSETVLGWLVGVDHDVSRQFLLFGFAITALALLIEAFVGASLEIFGFSGAESTGWWSMVLLAVVAVLGAVANGYGNDGVLVGTLVALAPLFGALLFDALVRYIDVPGIGTPRTRRRNADPPVPLSSIGDTPMPGSGSDRDRCLEIVTV